MFLQKYIPFLLLILLSACQPQAEESQHSEENEQWFFWSADWHPNKDQIVVGGSNDTFLKLFSANNLQELKTYPYKGTITKTKWHPTQNKIAISVQDGKSKPSILDLDKDELIELDSIVMAGARAIGWNRNGDLLAVGDYEGYLAIFDEKGDFIKKINTDQKAIIGLDWHPEQNLIVAVGESITMYDYELDSITQINDREEEIEVLMLCVAWHPSGDFFVSGDYGDFIQHYPPLLQYWDAEGNKLKSIEKSKAEYRNLKWNSDGMILATASEKVRLWDEKGNLIVEQAVPNLLWGIDWNQDGTQLLTTDEEKTIVIWDENLNKIAEKKY